MVKITTTGTRGKYEALGYRSVRVAARAGRTAVGGSGDAHMRTDRLRSIRQSREFYRDNPIYQGIIDRAIGYVIGSGFKLQSTTKAASWNTKAEALWAQWWKRPEVKQIMSGPRFERMIARELFVAGDTAILKTDKGLAQGIEAEQIAGKSGTDGVVVDSVGRPTKFLVAPYVNGRVASNATGYSPSELIFITNPDRPSSVRTMPPMQAAFAMLHRINDVCDSEAIAWQMLSRLALSRTRMNGPELAYAGSTAESNPQTEDSDNAPRVTELEYALIFEGEPGDEIRGVDRNLPGKDFPASLAAFLRLLGLPLGLPLEIVMLDWTKSNYSQSRAVLEQAFQTFLGWQTLLADFSMSGLYEWKVQEWIAARLLPGRQDALSHSWITPSFPWIDQLKEAQAQGAKLDRTLTTHGRVCKSLNVDRDEIVEARELEIRDAIDRASKIQAETGVVVPWQIFAGLDPKAPAPVMMAPPDAQNGDTSDG